MLQDKPLGANPWLAKAGQGGAADKREIFDYFEEVVAPSLATALRATYACGLSGVDAKAEVGAQLDVGT